MFIENSYHILKNNSYISKRPPMAEPNILAAFTTNAGNLRDRRRVVFISALQYWDVFYDCLPYSLRRGYLLFHH